MVHDPAVANTVEANAVNDSVADADKMKTVDDLITNAVEENAVFLSRRSPLGGFVKSVKPQLPLAPRHHLQSPPPHRQPRPSFV